MNKKKYKIIIVFLSFIFIVSMVLANSFALELTDYIYGFTNTDEVCNGIKNTNLQIGIHSFYDDNDTILNSSSSSSCTNSSYFSNNLKNVIEGEDYPTWTLYGRSQDFSHYVEGLDVTDSNKYKYFYINNAFKAYSIDAQTNTKKLKNTATLKGGEKIFVDLNMNDANIYTNTYNDLRIIMNYALGESDINISAHNAISYYVIDVNNNKYGPFKLADAELIKNLKYVNSNSEVNFSEYKIVSDNLSSSNSAITIPSNIKINKIRIVPYENYPVQSGMLRIYSIKVEGYSTNYSNGKEYIRVSNASTKVRQNITNNMATNGTIKWGVSEGRDLKFYCSLCGGNPREFSNTDKNGNKNIYYGLAYTNHIDATFYSFLSHTTKVNGINDYNFATEYLNTEETSRLLPDPSDSSKTIHAIKEKGSVTSNPFLVYEPGSYDNSNATRKNEIENNDYISNKLSSYFAGQDCSSSTFYAIGKELPYVDSLAGSNRYFTSSEVRLLGKMELEYSEVEEMLRANNDSSLTKNDRISSTLFTQKYSEYIKSKYASDGNRDVVYNGYALLKPGDALITDGHARMETGYTHLECTNGLKTDNYTSNYCENNGSQIDGDKSYVIVSEVRGMHINMGTTQAEYTTHVSQEDAHWTMHPDSRYTDIENIDDFYDSSNKKLTSFRFNKKYYFSDLYGTSSSFDPDSGVQTETDGQMYLPYRYKSFDKVVNEGTIEKPRVLFALGKEYDDDTRNNYLYTLLKTDYRLRGTLISNYVIDKIKITINNSNYYIYPNQTNVYSLYYDLNDESILSALKSLNYNNNNIIEISVYSGPNIDEVKDTLNLDSEGFMNVTTIAKSMYTVTFNSNGGSSVASQTVNYNEKATQPNNPTREGYTFVGWQLNGNTYDFNIVVNGNITLTAVWDKILKNILEDEGYNVINNYVYKFKIGDSVAAIKSELGNNVTIETDKTIISTGAVIKKSNESFIVVVKGDLTGDGKINSGDLLQMRKHLLEEVILTGAYKQAGIIESNGNIKSFDLLRLRQYLLGEYTFI